MATFGATFRKNGKILFYHLVTLFTSHRGTPLVLGGRGIESRLGISLYDVVFEFVSKL